VRRKPYSVILLDEIEKAHPDVWNILLQVLDEGRLTDNKGRVVNFRNTVVIMTSNLGSELIMEAFDGVTEKTLSVVTARAKEQVMELLRSTVRPEFLNRIDEIILFQPLLSKDLVGVLQIQLNGLKQLLATTGIELRFSEYALRYLAEQGYDVQMGARPLKRLIQKEIVNTLSKKIVAGEIDKEKPVLVDVFDNTVVFRNELLDATTAKKG
jgi:ATP-dependent Clp protease ATP-binding subunit ClpB